MNTFPNVHELHYLVSDVLGSSNVHTHELTPFQVGIFDSTNYKSIGSKVPNNVRFAIGSAHTGQHKVKGKLGNFANVGSVNRSYKLPVIDTRCCKVVAAGIDKAKSKSKQPIAYLGYDGVNYCGGLTFECDKAYYVSVELQGQPVRAMWGADICEQVIVKTDCCDACATGCTTRDMKERYLDELIRQLNEESLYFNRFVRFSKIIKRCPVPTPQAQELFTKYCLEKCDDGSAMTLARIQSQFPTLKVQRTSRDGAISKYETDYQLASLPTPASFSQQETVLQDCATCPVGATAVAGGDSYLITIDNDGSGTTAADFLTEVQAKYATATFANRLEFKYGTSTYEVTFATGFVIPAIIPTDTTIQLTGKVDGYCVMPATTFTWAACGSKYRVKRKLCTTIQNPDCNAAQVLTDLIAYYAADTSVVPGSLVIPSKPGVTPVTPMTDGCKTAYEIEQYSNLMEDGCDWTAEATFNPLQGWMGHQWNVCECEGWTVNANGCPVPAATTTEEFVAGIKAEVIYEDELVEGCGYSPYDAFDHEPIYINMTFGEWDKSTRSCSKSLGVPFKQTQNFEAESGRGHNIFLLTLMTQFEEGEVFYDAAHIENGYKLLAAEGLNYGIYPNKFYNRVYLTFDSTAHDHIHHSAPRRWSVSFWYEQNNIKTEQALKSLINKLLVKADLDPIA